MNNVTLSTEQIRTAMIWSDEMAVARARLEAAATMQQQYLDLLRQQYGLGPEWMCYDLLEGFTRPSTGEAAEGENHSGA